MLKETLLLNILTFSTVRVCIKHGWMGLFLGCGRWFVLCTLYDGTPRQIALPCCACTCGVENRVATKTIVRSYICSGADMKNVACILFYDGLYDHLPP